MTDLAHDDARFAVPLYTLAEAADALQVPAATFSTWAAGDERRRDGSKATKGGALVTWLQADGAGRPRIPFVGLAEGLVLPAFRRSGVPLQRIRPALEQLAREFGIAHALASRLLHTDGAEVLVDVAAREESDVAIERAVRELVVARSAVRVRDVLERFSAGEDLAELAEDFGLSLADVEDVVRAASRRAA